MTSKLAIDGGTPVRGNPMPGRGHFGSEEKAIVMKLFEECIAQGGAPGYGGAYETQYEQDFAQFMGGGFADGVNSGTNALFVALGGLQMEPFSEVIVPPISDPGGVMPVVFVGCVPVAADADARTYNTSVDQIKPMINERTRAIVIAHIAGDPVDMDPILELARSKGIYVVEDCAQAHGAKYKGRLVGTMGDISAFSTMFGKHHCTGGQGGVVFTRNEKLHWQARRFADRGKPYNIPDATGNVTAGLNCNLSELGAAIGIAQLKKLPEIVRRRRQVAGAIDQGLKSSKILSIGWQVPQTESSYWFLKLKLNIDAIRVDKNTFCKALTAEGLPINPDYRHIPSEAPWFKNKAVFGTSGFPWNCSEYKGPKNPQFKMDNAIKATETHFNLHFNESYGPKEIADTLSAFEKVEKAYVK
ncbi:MAG: DegT/DnrJ/EryC1/StrS family aminotransferase [Phycisphaerae bacterium]